MGIRNKNCHVFSNSIGYTNEYNNIKNLYMGN